MYNGYSNFVLFCCLHTMSTVYHSAYLHSTVYTSMLLCLLLTMVLHSEDHCNWIQVQGLIPDTFKGALFQRGLIPDRALFKGIDLSLS